ncbi:hypothetical protein [Yoonia sp. 208BN28-4]|uniref:hypothetical protein n=1 Tax=Yoonia sp. 208BN28-4 TaxID=3126505 RepID=UPI0030B6BD69
MTLAAAFATAGLAICATPTFAGVVSITELLDRDPLGYECIPSSYLEEADDGSAAIAFSLTGKTRLPRTCLPDPCARALTPRELSNITGTEMILARFSGEWDDYYARYADHCRREVTFPPDVTPDPVIAGPVRPTPLDPVAEFWPPIIERSRTIRRLTPPTSREGRPITTGLLTPAPWGIPIRVTDTPIRPVTGGGPRSIFMLTAAGADGGYHTPNDDVEIPLPTPTPSPVPLPASGWMLLAAAAWLGWRRKPVASLT